MLLGKTKVDLDTQLGKPVMARRITGLPGEKVWAYPWGDFEIVVGFLNDIARYLAVKKRRGPNTALTPAELAGALALNAPASQWKVEIPDAPPKKPTVAKRKTKIDPEPASYFSLVETDPKIKNKVLREIHGWMPGNKPYAFFFLPTLNGQPPILISEWGVAQAMD